MCWQNGVSTEHLSVFVAFERPCRNDVTFQVKLNLLWLHFVVIFALVNMDLLPPPSRYCSLGCLSVITPVDI